jgi:hypothetical protein
MIGARPRFLKKTFNAIHAETRERLGILGALGGGGQTETVRLMAEAGCGSD